VAPYVPPVPAADDPDATRLGAPVLAAAVNLESKPEQKPEPKAAAADESSEWPETVFADSPVGHAEPEPKPADVKSTAVAAASTVAADGTAARSAKAVKAAKPAKTAEPAPAKNARIDGAPKSSASPEKTAKTATTAKPPASRYVMWGVAGVVALACIGIGVKLMRGAGAPEAPGALQAAAAADTAAAPSAAPAASTPVVQVADDKTATPAAAQAAAPLSPASKAAAALAVANRKAALEKERLARQAAQTKGNTAAPAAAAAEHAATPAAAAAPTGPRQACEGRVLIGFQICMQEQCAKPAFTNHPVCVERRAMEQRRREAEQFSR
jgi:hypothetical protein